MNFDFKNKYNIYDLISIIGILRSKNGCPWDKEQTHKTLKSNLLEETYEVFEAIDNNDSELLKEELGDVLLQVVFHSQIEQENSNFSFDDVSDGICKKLILRHPHVFTDTKATTTDDVLANWEKIKINSKSQTPKQSMQEITSTLPSLLRASKLHSKSKKLKLYDVNINNMMNNTVNCCNNLNDSILKNSLDKTKYEKYIGELLFFISGLSSCLNIDPELALKKVCDEFLISL